MEENARSHGHFAFISYSSVNKNIADAIVADLEQHGIRCWYAPRDIRPGSPWMGSIVDHLNIPNNLKDFGVPEEDLETLVESGMKVQRLLVNNLKEVHPDDAREIYRRVMK